MTNKELTQNYWRYYRILEKKVVNTSAYVELDEKNYATYSNEYALLLQTIGSELDNFFKLICGFPLSDRKNISDYASTLIDKCPSILTQQIQVINSDVVLVPFHNWDKNKASKSLEWWSAFDRIKHNRFENFEDANLGNVLNALAALYYLEMLEYKNCAKVNENGHLDEPDSPDDASELFALQNWEFRYIRVGQFFAVIDGYICQILGNDD